MSYFGLVDESSVSMLFSSLSNTKKSGISTGTQLSFLSDYASIQNGSYKKLLSAYYNLDSEGTSGKESISTSKISAEKVNTLQKEADSLQKTTEELYSLGSKSVFRKVDVKQEDGTTRKDYNKEAIYQKVEEFAEDYNILLEAAEDVSSDSLEQNISSLQKTTESYRKNLEDIGIEIKSNGKLSVDEKKLKESDIDKVVSLFQGSGSYGYQVSLKAAMVESTAQREAIKSNTYNKSGNYSANYNYSYQSYI